MKKIKIVFFFLLIFSAIHAQKANRIVANPMDLNYWFQSNDPSRREAADPVVEIFKGKYYLFASKSGGYWSSEDLINWNYIQSKTITTIDHYAPTVLVLGDTIYYVASGSTHICYTTNPELDDWKVLNPSKFSISETDPAFFKDDDTGRVYIYWGCSDVNPIMGVELDPKDGFKSIGNPVVLIQHNTDRYGWEIPGNNNDENRNGWNEGPTVIKYKGKYYLQYASPGTQFRTYADGVCVGESPLGPFSYMENNPFTIKSGGFIGGAGHGHTFQDKFGNYWHVATMRVSQRHIFERRLGLFPIYFDENDKMYARTVWSDYPFRIPNKKVDFSKSDLSLNWSLLSYKKKSSASSSLNSHSTNFANDEQIETWWSAKTGDAGEWWMVDLGKKMRINAIQVNFADQDFELKAENSYFAYDYIIELSDDGKSWEQIVDKTNNSDNAQHELIVLKKKRNVRYLRITNAKSMEGKFSISDFRVFGEGNVKLPKKVTGLEIKRNTDKRRFLLTWDNQSHVTGYIVRWGITPNRLNNTVMVFENQLEAGFFNRDSEYYFSVEAFNEKGIH